MKPRLIKAIYYLILMLSPLLASTVQANPAKVNHCKNQCRPNYVSCSNKVSALCHRQHIQVMDRNGIITTPKNLSSNQLNAYEACRVRNVLGCSDELKQCEDKCN